MLELLGIRKPAVIGVDIGSTTVKLLELRGTAEHYRVERYSVAVLPDAAVHGKDIADVSLVAKTIEAALQQGGFKLKGAAIAVPASAAITKVIQMPLGLTEGDLEAQVLLEAAKHIPYAIEDVNLDFQALGPSADQEGVQDILLVAARSDIINLRVQALELAGLQPKYVDIESYALERAFGLISSQVTDADQKIVGVIDVGASGTTISIFKDGKNVYTREQEFGGMKLTEAIMQKYSLSFNEAGKGKREGGLPEDYEQAVLQPFQEALSQEIKRGLDFFYSSSAYSNIDHLLLGGATIHSDAMCKQIAEGTGVPAILVNPFVRMNISSQVSLPSLGNDAGALLVGCGLAMRSITG